MDVQNPSAGAVIALAVLAIVDLTLLVIALVRLARTPAERRSLPWPAWLAIIALVHPIGAIVFLVAGRTPAPVTGGFPTGIHGPTAAGTPDQPVSTQVPTPVRTASAAIDELYGPQQTGRQKP